VIAALRDRLGPRVAIFAPQFQPVSALFDEAGPAAAGTYVSLPGLTNDVLPAEGRRFAREFGATQPGGRVDVTAVYAAQATELLLDAIARSDGTRASVTKEVLAARVRGGLVGDFELTGTGDVTPRPITILRARQGGGAAVVGGTEGAVVDRVLDPPARLTELAP
jgi:hypothetical protein